jgi:phosphatidylglycerophosphatase A
MKWKQYIAIGFGTGLLPFGPGSWGTFPGMILYALLYKLHPLAYIFLILAFTGFGIHLATEGEKMFGIKDPKSVVIDEIVAFPVTMFLIPMSVGTLALGFLLNRLMDTTKVWPCHHLEKLPHGWGIMMDDLMAAVYSCLLMHLAIHLWPGLATYHL